ncbi:BRCT-containing protein 1 [Smittium culicis]|uniref:BRCT-containing protein 1 n=1 Tax=Smittium culicis TaxID=133412 RepID=A0A1R1XYN0_9FUNG|nr:BRCT-containing protein 1 [Smittium culicis]
MTDSIDPNLRKSHIFKNIVFWVNPSINPKEAFRISSSLEKRGASGASKISLDTNRSNPQSQNNNTKLRGFSVAVPPGLEENVFRIALPPSTKPQTLPTNAAATPSVPINLKYPTHIISKDIYFPEYQKCLDHKIKVVTPAWVDRSIRTGKIQPEEFFSCDLDENIFSGMVVTASQLPVSDREALYGGISAYGGQYRPNLVKDVTHLVLLTGTGSKYEQVLANPKLNIKIILPHWFEQCINLGILIDDKPYLFPDPKIFNMVTSSLKAPQESYISLSQTLEKDYVTRDEFNNFDVTQYLNDTLTIPHEDSDHPTKLALKNHNVALSLDLYKNAPPEFIAKIKKSVLDMGGDFITPSRNSNNHLIWSHSEFAKIDILVCQYRAGLDYFAATMLGKLVGSVIWLIKSLKNNELSQPGKQILDYPFSQKSIFNSSFSNPTTISSDTIISLSGYSKQARSYLKRLIVSMGAIYSPDLTKNSHTHLVTSDPNRLKFSCAREWNCHVINHLWIERCLQQEKNLSVSFPSYTFWPPLSPTSLQNTVGKNCSIKLPVLSKSFIFFNEIYKLILKNNLQASQDTNNSNLTSDTINGEIAEIEPFISDSCDIFISSNISVESERLKMFIFLSKVCGKSVDLSSDILNEILSKDLYTESDCLSFKNFTERKNTTDIKSKNSSESIKDSSDEESDFSSKKYSSDNIAPDKISDNNDLKPRKELDKIHSQMQAASIYETEMSNKSNNSESKSPPRATKKVASSSTPEKSAENAHLTKKRQHTSSSSPAESSAHKKAFQPSVMTIDISVNSSDNETNHQLQPPNVSTNSPNKKDTIKHTLTENAEKKKSSQRISILFTQGKPTISEEKKIMLMGGVLASDTQNATHLISSGVKRTAKFLEALNSGKIHIVTMQWLKHSISLKSWIDLSSDSPPENLVSLCKKLSIIGSNSDLSLLSNNSWVWSLGYGVSDPESELKFNFSLRESISKSRAKKLFSDIIVFATPSVQPSIDTLRKIVESGGGKLVNNYSSRKLKLLICKETVSIFTKPDSSNQKPMLLVVSCELDRQSWPLFLELSNYSKDSNVDSVLDLDHSSSQNLPIYSSEILLSGVLRQSLSFDTPEFRLM